MVRVAFICVFVLVGCSGGAPRVGVEGQDPEVMAVHQVVQETELALVALGTATPDKFTRYERAKLLYQLAVYKSDASARAEAEAVFAELSADAAFTRASYRRAELAAYYGSLHTLKARDFPGLWVINNLTPVGLVRLHYVNKGVAMLNDAVATDPLHPVVRLIRGNTYAHLPAFAGVDDEGLRDLEQLADWLEDASLNPAYQAILTEPKFRTTVYHTLALSYERQGRIEAALHAYEKLRQSTQGGVYGRLAESAVLRLSLNR